MLLLSILALFAGPLLYQWLRRGGLIARTVDRVIVALLVAVLALVLVPEVTEGLGYSALALVAVGYFIPGLLEAAVRDAARTFHFISLFIALAGLFAHALLDGAGLAGSAVRPTGSLAMAIVLHRFGMGLILWFMVWPAFGRRVAAAVLVLVSLATVLGFVLSGEFSALQQGQGVLVVQSLIVGTIVHSLVHRAHVHRGTHGEAGKASH